MSKILAISPFALVGKKFLSSVNDCIELEDGENYISSKFNVSAMQRYYS